ncbi:hypothetical protein J4444_03405 [Candidatus Woesearchaeota archaeon]|nr:hypothetical protein [Candidatus Woesearchaeota archaeon]
MVSYSSNASYLSNNSSSYSSSGPSSSLYAIKKNPHCCGSFSRGQRCMGCPGL